MDENWNTVVFNPTIINESKRIIQGVASAPVYDRQNELITADALKKAIHDFMVLPVLTVQHSQYVAGLVNDIWMDDHDRLCIKAHIKNTSDVDQVWDLIKAGKLNAFSITGGRKSSTCNVSGAPCITDDLFINSITICGDNKVNPEAYFDVVVKSIITQGDESTIMAEEEIKANEVQTPSAVDIAKAVASELMESESFINLIKSKEEEKKETETKDDNEDKIEKSFTEIKSMLSDLTSKYETLEKAVVKLQETPVEKAQFVVTDNNNIAQVVPQIDIAKAEEIAKKCVSRAEALLKMRLS